MSDSKEFESTKELLVKINEVVEKMDPAVRVATFDLLVSRYVTKQAPAAAKVTPTARKKKEGNDEEDASPDTTDLGSFIASFDTKKPNDALNVLVAWLYSQKGNQTFTVKDLKDMADDCGLTIPNRPDMTFKGTKSGGKAIYQQVGKNWKLTVSGELFMRESFKVTKGSSRAEE